MKRRLLKARSCLLNKYKKLFKEKIYVESEKVMVSDNFKYYLKLDGTGVELFEIADKDSMRLRMEVFFA